MLSGPFNLRDAVAMEGEGADEIDVLDRLSSLVNRSLVVHSHDLMPYRMLETIRAFGRMSLDADGQSEATCGGDTLATSTPAPEALRPRVLDGR